MYDFVEIMNNLMTVTLSKLKYTLCSVTALKFVITSFLMSD